MTRRTFISLLAVFSTLFVARCAVASDAFEGTKWTVTIAAEDPASNGNEKGFEDVITFKGGKFAAAKCVKRGFAPVDYEEDTRRGPIAAFTAEQTSKTEGKFKWTGTVTGDQMKGDLTWTKQDGTVLHYSINGIKTN